MIEETKPEKKSKYPVGEDAAIAQIEILADYYEIDMEEDHPILHKGMIKSIRRGRISIEEDPSNGGILVQQHLRNQYNGLTSPIRWYEITSRHKIAAERMLPAKDADKPHAHNRLLNLSAAITANDRDVLAQLTGVDMSSMEVLAAFFTNV